MPVEIRATEDAALQDLLRVVIAGVRSGAAFVLSTPVGLPGDVRRALGDLDASVFLETDEEWMQRMLREEDVVEGVVALPVSDRVRLVGGRAAVAALHTALATASGGDPDLAVYDGEVTAAARIELLPFVHEQSISITAHRYGNLDPWSSDVI
ncbi:hypothetical protein [Microbacterium sp. B19(2022)]|uniref:hypothetical protein n=1 Tax=Microbacterium sp. B19(2022) TaxID=2914045 RepID=UPI001F3AC25B|nr:hypothetical protein [Microbacterium sp. B19(2022)]